MKFLLILLFGCSSMTYNKTVDYVDIKRFMGDWYVITGRTSFLEKGAHNALEKYTWNERQERIDIDFTFNADSLDGKLKSIPQKAWIHNSKTNAHWKVQPFWPLKFNYLVIALDSNYQWTAIGVPDQAYLWIMARDPKISASEVQKIIKQVEATGYSVKELVSVPHR